ncbi:MAG: hypothetical protein M0D53_15240 [Flavobacterium sp. JAD_PAG50586_2]|nr:MAG: hypothetical protein M0D53_15240 [Flavobacterium sp. JAD_PAG50586_2]
MNNFNTKKITLKDVSTLTTMVIKCCRKVDDLFFKGISEIKEFSDYKKHFITIEEFKKIHLQSKSDKRERQIEKWVRLNYHYLEEDKIEKLLLTLYSKD